MDVVNCLLYAVRKLWKEGGYLLIRRSRFGEDFGLTKKHPLYYIPHFLHRDLDKNVTQYVPTEKQKIINQKRGPWLSWLNIWKFEGKVIGDDT